MNIPNEVMRDTPDKRSKYVERSLSWRNQCSAAAKIQRIQRYITTWWSYYATENCDSNIGYVGKFMIMKKK